jgi:hypothetical protein
VTGSGAATAGVSGKVVGVAGAVPASLAVAFVEIADADFFLGLMTGTAGVVIGVAGLEATEGATEGGAVVVGVAGEVESISEGGLVVAGVQVSVVAWTAGEASGTCTFSSVAAWAATEASGTCRVSSSVWVSDVGATRDETFPGGGIFPGETFLRRRALGGKYVPGAEYHGSENSEPVSLTTSPK